MNLQQQRYENLVVKVGYLLAKHYRLTYFS